MSRNDRPRRRRQRQREADEQLGPDQSETVYTFTDGWTIRRPHTIADVAREGILLDNCLHDVRSTLIERKALRPDQNPAEFEFDEDVEPELGHLHSLRDPDNYPRAVFAHLRPLGTWGLTGKGNTPVKAEYRARVEAWHETLPWSVTLHDQVCQIERWLFPRPTFFSLDAA